MVIFGIKIGDIVSKKFGFNIFQYSFGDGNLLYTIEINSSEPLEDIEKNKSLIHFFLDKEKKTYSYRLVFKNRKNLIDFEKQVRSDPKITNVRVDMQS